MVVYKTVSPHRDPPDPEAKFCLHRFIGDEEGRLVIVGTTDSPLPIVLSPNPLGQESTIREFIVDAGVDIYENLPSFAVTSLAIRNPGNKYIRVANSEEGNGGDYVTIAPKFARRFAVTDQDQLWVRRADGLAAAYRIELVAEHP